MGNLEETPLPGLGRRLEFVTDEGRRMGVVLHHGGRREVFVCQPGNPDTTEVSVKLSEDDSHSLAEALDVLTVTSDDAARSYEIEGLVFDWIDVPDGSAAKDRSIAELRVRTRTGASIVAVIRPAAPVPAPDPDFVIEVGDTVVVAGTAEGVESARHLLTAS